MLGGLLEEAALGAEAGVGEDDVDAPEGVERGRGQALLLAPVHDVARDDERAARAAELLAERLEAVAAARGEHQAVARPRRPGAPSRRRCRSRRR